MAASSLYDQDLHDLLKGTDHETVTAKPFRLPTASITILSRDVSFYFGVMKCLIIEPVVKYLDQKSLVGSPGL